MGSSQFDPGCCCGDCDIGSDDFPPGGVNPTFWDEDGGAWTTDEPGFDGLWNDTAGRLIFIPSHAADDGIRVTVTLIPLTASAAMRVIVGYQDADNYLYVEVHIDEECSYLQLGQVVDGDETELAGERVSLFENANGELDRFQLRVCLIPQETEGQYELQAIVKFLPELSLWESTELGQVGLAWLSAIVTLDSPTTLRAGLEQIGVGGEWFLPNETDGIPVLPLSPWKLEYHRQSPDHKSCPNCKPPECTIFYDTFGRDDGELGCHWDVSGTLEIDGGQVVCTTAGLAIALHELIDAGTDQYASVVATLQTEGQTASLVFGYAGPADYYRLEWSFTNNAGQVQWHLRLLFVDTELATEDSIDGLGTGSGDQQALLQICFSGGSVLATASGGGGQQGVDTPDVGLRFPLVDLTGRFAGIAGDEGVLFDQFGFYRRVVVGEGICFRCVPYTPPCAGCINEEAPEIFMGTLAGAIRADTLESVLDGDYLTQAIGHGPDCCYWAQIGCPTIGGLIGALCDQNPPLGWQTFELQNGTITSTGAAAVTAVYVTTNKIYAAVNYYDVNSIPPDVDNTGLSQQALFWADMPENPDCLELDLLLTPVPMDELEPEDLNLCGGTPSLPNNLVGIEDSLNPAILRGVNFENATLRIRAAAL